MSDRRLWVGLLLCIALAGIFVGCAKKAPEETPAPEVTRAPVTFTPMITPSAPGELAATVNGQGVLRSKYEEQVAQFQAAMVSQGMSFSGEEGKPLALEVRRQVLEAMIEEVLIAQVAASKGITVTNAVLQQRVEADMIAGGGAVKFNEWLQNNNMTREQYGNVLRNQLLTDELMRQLGTKVPDKMRQIHLRQILVEDEATARDLRKRLDGGANFAELAKKYSLDEESRENGGDRGFLPVGMGVIEEHIEITLVSAAPGQVFGPIPSPFGFYVVQVMAIEDQRALTPEMRQGLLHDNFVTWLEEEKAKAKIERNVKFE